MALPEVASPPRSPARGLGRFRRPLSLGLFVEAPLIVVAFVFWWSLWGNPDALGDFVIFRDAGQAVLDGASPYPAADAAVLAENDKFVYPAPVALAFVPFALLPLGLAKAVFLILSLAAVLLALRLFGVRDYRCYAAALLASPTVFSLEVGALGPVLLLGAAVAWRFRGRPLVAAGAVALTALAKLLLWPLVVWLVATRRLREAAAAVFLAAAVTAAGWAVIGFEGLADYPALVRLLSEVQVWKAYSPGALAWAFGASNGVVTALTVVLLAAGTALVVVLARRRDGDRSAFVAAIGVALLASPILWHHYLVLLFAPIALARPRFTPLWFVPALLWATPRFESLGSVWQICLALAVVGAVLARALRADPRPAAAAR